MQFHERILLGEIAHMFHSFFNLKMIPVLLITMGLFGSACLKKSDSSFSTYQGLTNQDQGNQSQICSQNQAFSTPSACSQSMGGAALQTNCVAVTFSTNSGGTVSCYRLPTSCNSGDTCKMLNNGQVNTGIWGGPRNAAVEVAVNYCASGSANSIVALAGLLISCQ
jgi:hypothetical protein